MVAIPTSFHLMGRQITVEQTHDLSFNNGNLGEAVYRENKIRLQQNIAGYARPQDDIEQTFFHEILHFILHFLGKYELRDDEEFIEQVSGLIHQAFATAVYTEDTK